MKRSDTWLGYASPETPCGLRVAGRILMTIGLAPPSYVRSILQSPSQILSPIRHGLGKLQTLGAYYDVGLDIETCICTLPLYLCTVLVVHVSPKAETFITSFLRSWLWAQSMLFAMFLTGDIVECRSDTTNNLTQDKPKPRDELWLMSFAIV